MDDAKCTMCGMITDDADHWQRCHPSVSPQWVEEHEMEVLKLTYRDGAYYVDRPGERQGDYVLAQTAIARIAALEAQLREREEELEKDAALYVVLRARAESAETALAAARAENEQIRIALGKQQAETCRILRETRADVENMSLDGDVMTANLRARPDDKGRVERVAREMYRVCSDSRDPWDERTDAVHEIWTHGAECVLSAADGAERGGR